MSDKNEEAVEPMFSADLNNPDDMELLIEYFGREAIDKAFGEDGGGIEELERNASRARFSQKLNALVPPEIRERDRELRRMWEMEKARKRQTREPEEPEIKGEQLSLF